MALINLRNALMTGKRLPYDAEVEYLESTGTQWINTGLNYFADFEIGIKLRKSVANKSLGTAATMCLERYSANNPYWNLRVNGTDYKTSTSIVDYHVMSWKGGVFAADGVTAYTVSNPFASGTMTLFGAGGQYFPNMIYACKLWDANGVLVRDFIPVRKGTVGYLYDRVSGLMGPFGNAGSGDFVLGPDVVPVEYIGISGGAYIDTGVVASQASMQSGLDVEIVASFAVRASSQATFKNRLPYFFVGTNGSDKFYSGLGQTYTNTNVANDGAMHVLRISSTTCAFSIDGEVVTQYQSPSYTGSSSGNILIGACSNDTAAPSYFASMRVAGCSIRNSNVLSSHFLPVRVGTDATSWEGAMMDTLTRRIYRNAGTGAFTYGNDLKYPIPAE